MNQIFKMREKSKKSTKPIHEPNFLNWTKTGKIDKTPVFQLVSWTKKEKYDSRIGHTSFSEYIKLDRDKSTFKSHRDFNSEKEISFKHF